MCGITGFIGCSKKPIHSYQLITKLFEKSEVRGTDAAGFWATQNGKNGKVLYHKEPVRSSKFIKNEIWKQVFNLNPNLMLAHARRVTKGMGQPSFNENNHPFTSTDRSKGLIHNGKINESEYLTLKEQYQLNSDCDSELLLRIFEAGEASCDSSESEVRSLFGINRIHSVVNEAQMAVAIGERHDEDRNLWLFRNEHRPLWIADVRESLGQIFFVSEPSVWEKALYECNIRCSLVFKSLIEVSTNEIWLFKITKANHIPEDVKKYKIHKENLEKDKYFEIIKKHSLFEVVTELNDKEQVVKDSQEYDIVSGC